MITGQIITVLHSVGGWGGGGGGGIYNDYSITWGGGLSGPPLKGDDQDKGERETRDKRVKERQGTHRRQDRHGRKRGSKEIYARK